MLRYEMLLLYISFRFYHSLSAPYDPYILKNYPCPVDGETDEDKHNKWKQYDNYTSYRAWREQFIIRNLFYNRESGRRKYNRYIRPVPYRKPTSIFNTNDTNSSSPVIVLTSLNLKSISTVKEVSMEFKVQFMFQQEWFDERLRYDDKFFREFEYIHLSRDQILNMWIPDTFFQNEKEGKYHCLDKDNFYIMIRSDGKVLYNRRLTMTFSCVMDLLKYPLDNQTCNIQFASYAYTTEDIVYVWDEQPVLLSDKASSVLSNFEVVSLKNKSCTHKTATGEYSCLQVDLELKRVFSFFLLQLYIPSSMLVAVSWVSYWIDWRATAGRVPLAIVTLLTMITQSHAINANLPPVSYTKAVDVWVGACVVFIFGSLIEYAFVNYTGIREQRQHSRKKVGKIKRLWETVRRPRESLQHQHLQPLSKSESQERIALLRKRYGRGGRRECYSEEFRVINNSLDTTNLFPEMGPIDDHSTNPLKMDMTVHFEDVSENVDWIRLRTQRRVELFRWCNMLNQRSRAERIDIISRAMFPAAFIMFNIVYWIVYW